MTYHVTSRATPAAVWCDVTSRAAIYVTLHQRVLMKCSKTAGFA
jgi:hypothetical protein